MRSSSRCMVGHHSQPTEWHRPGSRTWMLEPGKLLCHHQHQTIHQMIKPWTPFDPPRGTRHIVSLARTLLSNRQQQPQPLPHQGSHRAALSKALTELRTLLQQLLAAQEQSVGVLRQLLSAQDNSHQQPRVHMNDAGPAGVFDHWCCGCPYSGAHSWHFCLEL